MKIILSGATGFIGKALAAQFANENHEVVILTRRLAPLRDPASKRLPTARLVTWDLSRTGGPWEEEMDGAEVVINLAGASIVEKRWSPAQKKGLLESRMRPVAAIRRAMEKASPRPKVFVSASAIGYYGPRGDEILDENSSCGTGFLADLCKQWEEEVMKAEALNVRTIRLRIGLVLEKDGGMMSKMLPPFLLGLGGPLGSGRQWMSWIHRHDLIQLILFLLDHSEAFGVFNATALNPIRMEDFAKTLAKILHRPCLFRVTSLVLKILLGELSDMLLTGQCVLPQRAIQLGFSFRYPTLDSALCAVLKPGGGHG